MYVFCLISLTFQVPLMTSSGGRNMCKYYLKLYIGPENFITSDLKRTAASPAVGKKCFCHSSFLKTSFRNMLSITT